MVTTSPFALLMSCVPLYLLLVVRLILFCRWLKNIIIGYYCLSSFFWLHVNPLRVHDGLISCISLSFVPSLSRPQCSKKSEAETGVRKVRKWAVYILYTEVYTGIHGEYCCTCPKIGIKVFGS